MKAVLGSTVFLLFNSLFLGSAFAQSYDVSGVQILMTPDQVKTALNRQWISTWSCGKFFPA